MMKNIFFHRTKLDKSDIPGGWPPEANNIEEIVDEYRKVATDLSKCISNCIPSLGIPDAEKRIKKIPESKVGNMFNDAGEKFQCTKPELRYVYTGIGETVSELAVSRRDFETGVEEKIVNHLKKLADDELPEIQKDRKTLSKFCNDLKTANERLDNVDVSKQPAEKIQQMRSNQEEIEQRALSQKDQTLKALFQFDARCRENSLHILEYLELSLAYHSRCAATLQQRIPQIRDHIQKSMISPAFRTPMRQHLQEAGSELAYVLRICIKALNKESALKEEGLFRTAGSKTKVDILTHALDAKRANSLIHECEYSVIADALKQYFRFMEEPLLQSSLFDEWMRAMQQPSVEERLRALWNVMHTLPDENRTNLRYLIKFLAKVSTFSEHNRMTPGNLGIVFGPNLLKPINNSSALGMMSSSMQSAIVEHMITHADWFFPDSADMFCEFTKESDSNQAATVAPTGPTQDGAYVNLALEANGPSNEMTEPADASPTPSRKSVALSTRASFSPTSSSAGTMPRRKAPLPPGLSPSRAGVEAAEEPPFHTKSMPSVLTSAAAHGGPLGTTEEGLGDSSVSINTAVGTVKLKAATMPQRPVSMPPKPALGVEPSGLTKAPPPRPKKPSFNPPAPPENAGGSEAAQSNPGEQVASQAPPRPVEPPGPKPSSVGSTSDTDAPESTHL